MKKGELKEKKLKIKKLFFKPVIVSIDDTERFEQIELKKKSPIKNYWYKWLINYILGPIRKTVDIIKNKVVSLFETNIRKYKKIEGRKLGIDAERNQANQKHKNQSEEENNQKSFFFFKKKKKKNMKQSMAKQLEILRHFLNKKMIITNQ